MRRRSKAITRLEDHPNLVEILGVLAQLPHIGDGDLPRLAEAWNNTVYVAEARDRALSPDSPLVLEVLAAFEAVSALFADDLDGEADYILVDPRTTTLALKAVRDAIAAVYARPALTRGEYLALLRPWREVYPVDLVHEPDLGPQAAQVKSLLAALPGLATRCHDESSRELFEFLVDTAWLDDHERHDSARDEAWQAAVLTGRRRLWTLVRRTGAEGISRPCPTCRGLGDDRDEQRVLTLCLDAACALLVADAIPDAATDVLTAPVARLVPLPRRAAD